MHQSRQFDMTGWIKKVQVVGLLSDSLRELLRRNDRVVIFSDALFADALQKPFGVESVGKDQYLFHWALFGYNFAHNFQDISKKRSPPQHRKLLSAQSGP
jgi:hypothetical protein